MTCLKVSIDYFNSIYLLEIDHLNYLQLKQKTFLKKLSLLPLFIWNRIKFVVKMKYVASWSACLGVALWVVLKYGLKWKAVSVLSPFILLLLFITFTILEVYLEIIRFLTNLFFEEISCFKDKLPVVLNLLRLPSKGSFSSMVDPWVI